MAVILDDEFACSVADYWDRVFLTEAYQERLHVEGLGFRSYCSIEHREDSRGCVHRVIEVAGVPGLPGVLQRLIPGGGYVEKGRLVRAQDAWDFVIEPGGVGGRISIRGNVNLQPIGPERCRRTGEVRIEVRLPGLARQLSRSLTGLTELNQQRSAAFTHQFIEELTG